MKGFSLPDFILLLFLCTYWGLGNDKIICEDGTGTISCTGQPGFTLDIKSANYGRTSTEVCQHDNKPFSNTGCISQTSLAAVQELCQDKESCQISATNGAFGDTCPGTWKYLEVHFTCKLICGQPSISNGRAEVHVTADGILAAYSCNQHYKLTGGDATRSCQSGGAWDGQQPRCAYMNSCSSNPCLNAGSCTNGLDTFRCTCPLAWSGIRCGINIVDCGDPGDIQHGSVSLSSTKYGSTATYYCDDHFNMTVGDSLSTCQMDFTWTGTKPTCTSDNKLFFHVNRRERLTPSHRTSGSALQMPGFLHRNKCQGKKMESDSASRVIQNSVFLYRETGNGQLQVVNACGSNPCQNSGTCINGLDMYTCLCATGWTGINCEEDIQPPILEQCPSNIHRNATKRTIVVSWTEPVFSDPFKNSIEITSNYPQPEFEFPWGDFTAQYVATKVNNGLEIECTFNISVRPTPCEELNIPQNGARICNGWKTDYIRVCLLACKQNYTIPPSHSYKQLYVCGASGHWIFPGPLPDCSVGVNSEEEALVYQPSSVSPTFLSCDDEMELEPVKQNYIDVLTQSGELSAYCHKYKDECHPDNVAVTCQ